MIKNVNKWLVTESLFCYNISYVISTEMRCIMIEQNENWVSIEEAAKYMDVKPRTIRSWIQKEDCDIPAHKIGKQWKFKMSELDAWVKSGKSAM